MITETEIQPTVLAPLAKWNPDIVRSILVEVLTEIQELGGNTVPEFTDNLRITMDLAQFDSLVAIDALETLSERFEESMPDDLFCDPKTQQPLRLDQVVERICQVLGPSETAKDE